MENDKKLEEERARKISNMIGNIAIILFIIGILITIVLTAKEGLVQKDAREQLEQLIIEKASKNEIIDTKEAVELANKANYSISLEGIEVDILAKNAYEYEVIGIEHGDMILILREKQGDKSR